MHVVSVARVSAQRTMLASLVRGFDPAELSGDECEQVLAHATAMKHMAATLESLAANRAAQPAEQLAQRTGTTANKAGDAMRTADRRRGRPFRPALTRAGGGDLRCCSGQSG